MSSLELILRPIAELKSRPGNPRTHSKKQIEQLAKSIQKFGFTNPVLVDDEDCVVAGHGRLAAAKLLDLTEAPTIKLKGMTDADLRAYVIADNKLAENAGWDKQKLAEEFKYLLDLKFDFDTTLTGFELAEIDALINEDPISNDPADVLPEGDQSVIVTQLGDVWQIGRHRLICGDATNAETYIGLMGGERAGMVFADGPYNVKIDGHVSGLGKIKHREFQMASGEMTPEAFTNFLRCAFTAAADASRSGAIHFQCMDWRHVGEMLAASEGVYSELKNICIWSKANGGMGSLYRSAHEMIFVFKVGEAPHVNNIELGRHGRFRTNVWSYPGANGFSATRTEDLASHPTVKPVSMVVDAILDCSKQGDIILDPFAGSGTTLLAAHKTRRRGFGIEIDPIYCDLIVRRMKKATKLEAVLASDQRFFAAVAADRAGGEEAGQ